VAVKKSKFVVRLINMELGKSEGEGDATALSSQARNIQIVTSTMAKEFEKSATEIAASVSFPKFSVMPAAPF
jgi:hypothetical protein